jgi:ABC-type amino acid transport substrate-binding protein
MSDRQPMDKKLSLIIVLWLGLMLLLSGCQGKISSIRENQLSDATLRNPTTQGVDKQMQIQQNGVLVVGTAITNPFEFYDPEGHLVGLDIDITNFIAQELGVEVQFVEMSFANLIPALQDNKVDMTIAAMYITPEREDLVDFSNPYIETGLVMVVQPGMKTTIKTVEDLKGMRVGVKIGSTGANFAQELISQGYPLQVTEYKDTFTSLLDLEVDRVDVVFNDYLNTLTYIKDSQSQLNIVVDEKAEVIYLSKVGLGIAVPEGNQEFLKFINETLIKMKQTGHFQKSYKTWLLPKQD